MQPSFLSSSNEKLTRSIEGSLSLMPLADLIQWIESAKRSGTLVATNDDITRRFYFQNGNLIFVWNDSEQDRFYDAIQQQTGVPLETLHDSMIRAEQLGISFMGYLSSEQGIHLEQLTGLITRISEEALSKSLTWKAGSFKFSDYVPAIVLCSPVTLSPSQVLLNSAVQFDEGNLEAQISIDPVLDEVYDLIRKGAIDLPPLPTEMQLLMNRINDPQLSIEDIIECVTDPLLVSKVLRVTNSSFYGHRVKIGTMREAVVYMGLKSLMSIVTVHALSDYSPRNADKVQKVLHHSLKVGMIAKQLAHDMGLNQEHAFTCGLLHDLGWVVLIEIFSGYDLSPEKFEKLILQHHGAVGGLIAKKWNLAEEVQDVVRYHHEPANAKHCKEIVELIHLADLLAKNEAPPDDCGLTLPLSEGFESFGAPFEDHLQELDREIDAILSPV